MLQLPPSLELNLLIEHEGYQLRLTGRRLRFLASFSTLLSAAHFARQFWIGRHLLPTNVSVQVRWKWVTISIV